MVFDATSRSVIVTGGAGYIGSHAVLGLKERGWQPVIVDNFSRGNRVIADRLSVPVIEGDCGNRELIASLCRDFRPVAIMHFAAFAYVGESVQHPSRYYENNVGETLSLLQALLGQGIKNIVFSSTCATYGEVDGSPIGETMRQNPVNPYGRSKLMIEQILHDYQRAYGLNVFVFRYFNAGGCDPGGRIGECHEPETHLIPRAIFAAQGGPQLAIFGDDYHTPDGTCIRDYVHVTDIAHAHVLGLESLAEGGSGGVLNLGNGSGYSVRQIIEAVAKVAGAEVPNAVKPRRPGDPAVLVADATLAHETLGWKPKFPDIEDIIRTSWSWYTSAAYRECCEWR